MKKRKNLNVWLAMVMFLMAMVCTAAGRSLYVDADAPGANNGSSWADAFNYLQDGLADANTSAKPVEILVAQGIYKPDKGVGITPGDRTATFQLINDVIIKGGYAGFGSPDPDARDVDQYQTILSGDLNGDDVEVADLADLLYEPSRAENSYHVVTGSGTDSNAILGGFTITKGNATRLDDYGLGGGIYCSQSSPTIIDCVIKGNAAHSGGGMYNKGDIYLSLCYPTLIDCTFSDNSALVFGGGMYNSWHCHPKLINCTFRDNSAGISGGGMSNYWISHPNLTNCAFYNNHAVKFYGGGMDGFAGCNPKLTNCVFSDNSSGDEGGGISNDMYCDPELINCTFHKNESATYGGGIFNYFYCDPVISNCIFWDNADSEGQGEESQIRWGTPVINYSCVEGWTGELGGDGNIGDDPLFVNAADPTGPDGKFGTADDGLALKYYISPTSISPCIDAGDPNYPYDPNETDLDGNPRVINGRIDMGAYEYLPPILAEVRIVPRTINLASKGKWITAFLWLPEDYDVADIDPNSVFLEDEIAAGEIWLEGQVAIVKFSRAEVQEMLEPGDVDLTVSGELCDGTRFEGTDTIRMIDKGRKK